MLEGAIFIFSLKTPACKWFINFEIKLLASQTQSPAIIGHAPTEGHHRSLTFGGSQWGHGK